jgi:broad specificity phosphatase PhoE
VLVRHGETEWSTTRRHTGRTDVPLSDAGRRRAEALRPLLPALLPEIEDAVVAASPLRRARDTGELAGFGGRDEVWTDLAEWDYGVFEGRTTAEIRETIPGWSVWTHPIDGGESLADVARRADRVIARVLELDRPALVFAHAHLLRILGARWCGLEPTAARALTIDPAGISILGWEHEYQVIERWNLATIFTMSEHGSASS